MRTARFFLLALVSGTLDDVKLSIVNHRQQVFTGIVPRLYRITVIGPDLSEKSI